MQTNLEYSGTEDDYQQNVEYQNGSCRSPEYRSYGSGIGARTAMFAHGGFTTLSNVG
ncbi:hypothetical protein [Paenibacillus sp. 22594]|uniref:hypothetical protein n=1 Tax=Paenibacillus sp. 22594 TaxID=3453947 RepID=UPI003F84EA97